MSESARERIDRIARELYALGATDTQVREFGQAIAALLFSNILVESAKEERDAEGTS